MQPDSMQELRQGCEEEVADAIVFLLSQTRS